MPITGPEPGCFGAGARWDGRPVETARLHLRAPLEADIPAMVELAGDWEVSRQTAFIPHPYGESDARAFLRGVAEERATGKAAVLAIERRLEPGLIGAIGAHFRVGGRAEIGYWLGQPHWGQGFATEAVKNMLPLAFAGPEIGCVYASAMADNPASARVLEKAGFTRTGEQVGCGDQGRCAGKQTILYEITRDDWQAQVAARPVLLVVAVALVDADGRVLLASRPAGRRMAGLWEFPGGKVGDGETPEAALIRELHEELGIDITESCLAPLTFASHSYDDFHLLMPLYVCRVWKGEVTAREGQQLTWVRPNRMRGYPMPPADEPLVAMLRDLL